MSAFAHILKKQYVSPSLLWDYLKFVKCQPSLTHHHDVTKYNEKSINETDSQLRSTHAKLKFPHREQDIPN